MAESGISEKELRDETKDDRWMQMKRFMSRFRHNATRIGTLALEASQIKSYTSSLNEAMQRFLVCGCILGGSSYLIEQVSMTLYMAFEVQEANQKLTRIERNQVKSKLF